MIKFNISEESINLINELINKGWEVMIRHGDCETYTNVPSPCFEVDFTRKLEGGFWDNHEGGYSLDVNEAIKEAYDNIINGIKFGNKKG